MGQQPTVALGQGQPGQGFRRRRLGQVQQDQRPVDGVEACALFPRLEPRKRGKRLFHLRPAP